MSSNSNDLRQWIQELITRSASDQLYNLQRFEEVVRRATRGDIEGSTLRDEYLEFAREESSRYINDLTRVGLSFYNTLIELNRQYNDRFFEKVTESSRHHNGSTGNNGDPMRVVEMTLHAPVGGVATRSFIIENQKGEIAQVSFLVSEFSDASGQTGFRPPLQLKPARLTMNPGEERAVTLSVPLLPEFFAPGQVYSATLIASGFPHLQLKLTVHAEPPLSPGDRSGEAVDDNRKESLIFQPVEEVIDEENDTDPDERETDD